MATRDRSSGLHANAVRRLVDQMGDISGRTPNLTLGTSTNISAVKTRNVLPCAVLVDGVGFDGTRRDTRQVVKSVSPPLPPVPIVNVGVLGWEVIDGYSISQSEEIIKRVSPDRAF